MSTETGIEKIKPSLTITDEDTPNKRKKKASVKGKEEAISKNTIGIIRTKLRNNIELTNIADNKANVLLSLNALMLTFLLPFVIKNIDLVIEYQLAIPTIVLVLSSLVTIFLAVLALKPGKFTGQNFEVKLTEKVSPFFFGNFEKMNKEEYMEYFSTELKDEKQVLSFLSNDFYHVGLRLGEKMRLIRKAFNIFIAGLSFSILVTIILMLIKLQ